MTGAGDFRNKRILVTGATGFIGANLVRSLVRQGASVHAIVRHGSNFWRIEDIVRDLTLHSSDVTDREGLRNLVSQIRPEIIFHLAAQGLSLTQRDSWDIVKINVLGTANLLEASAGLSLERFVHIGGSSEYGAKPKAMKETDRVEPVTLYGATKAAATLLAEQAGRTGKLPLVVLRPFSVYGYWESHARLIPAATLAVLRNQEIRLTSPGYCRDFIFVEDLVDACLTSALASKVVGQTINVGTGQQWTNEEVVSTIQTAARQEVKVNVGSYPAHASDTTQWVADIRKARRLLGWEPRHDILSGLEKTVHWFRENENIYDASS